MTEVAGQPLIEAQVQSLTIANRTPTMLETWLGIQRQRSLCQSYPTSLIVADLFTSHGARLPFIGKGLMERVRRKRSPVFILIRSPRDVG